MEKGAKHQYPYTPARLVDDPATPYLVFYAWHIQKEKKVRLRTRVPGNTPAERTANAERLIKEINKNLADGWHVNETGFVEAAPRPKPTEPDGVTPKTPLLDAYQYYRAAKAKELRASTLELDDHYIRHLTAYLDKINKLSLPLGKVTASLLHGFFDQVETGARFRNNMLGFVRGLFNFFIRREVLDRNPALKVELLRVDESDDHKPFTPAQARDIRQQILDRGDQQLWLFVQFAYYLFIRPGKELRLLKVADILTDQVKVSSGNAKNRRTGFVDIPTPLQTEIERLNLREYPAHYYVFTIDGKPGPTAVGENYFYKRHRKVLEKLGLFGQDYDLYSWKPTGAIVLALDTKDVLRVQRHCRHASPDQTFTYLRKFGVLFNQIRVTDFPAIWE